MKDCCEIRTLKKLRSQREWWTRMLKVAKIAGGKSVSITVPFCQANIGKHNAAISLLTGGGI